MSHGPTPAPTEAVPIDRHAPGMAEAQPTYLAHLATLGIDVTQIVTDRKGTVISRTSNGDRPHPAVRLPRLLLGSDEPGAADLELGDPLGKGGMGVVWSATQVALRRRVAVKRLRDERVGPAAEAQLLREALVTGALEHPNVVPVHALGEDGQGRPLLVMKQIEGTPWSALLRPLYPDEGPEDGPADAREIERHLGILMQVCQALDFAHARGVIHRDIKPENVMVGSFGEVYVLDWGIAVSTRGGDQGLPPPEAGVLVGTPAYMAPEMAAAEPVDARTDVYLLGATLHELVTGRPRHQADGVFATLTLAFESEPVEYPDHVPVELAEICNRATRRDPAQRYASAQEVRDAVAEFLRHGSSRELAKEGWQRLERLEGVLGPGTASTDAIEIHVLATEGRFAFERACQEWPGNVEARTGLQRLLERMIRWELSNGNVSAAAGLLAALPEPHPRLEHEVEQARRAELERQREIAKLEKLRYDGDIDVFSASRRRIAYLHGLTLGLLAVGLFALRRLGLHQPGYLDAIVVTLVLGGVAISGRRSARIGASNEVNRRLYDSILASLLFVELVFCVGWWGGLPFPVSLALVMLIGGASTAVVMVFFDHRVWWSALGFVLTAVAIMAMPELRGLWIAIGGFGSFAAGAIVWRDVEQGRRTTQQRIKPVPRASTPGPGTPRR